MELFDLKLVESEDSEIIYHFLNESLKNQDIVSISRDLKHEYRQIIYKLKLKHHFVNFMRINVKWVFKDYFGKNIINGKNYDELIA